MLTLADCPEDAPTWQFNIGPDGALLVRDEIKLEDPGFDELAQAMARAKELAKPDPRRQNWPDIPIGISHRGDDNWGYQYYVEINYWRLATESDVVRYNNEVERKKREKRDMAKRQLAEAQRILGEDA